MLRIMDVTLLDSGLWSHVIPPDVDVARWLIRSTVMSLVPLNSFTRAIASPLCQ